MQGMVSGLKRCVLYGGLLLDEWCNCNFEGVFVIGNEELRCCEESLCEENAKWDCSCFQFLLNCNAFQCCVDEGNEL